VKTDKTGSAGDKDMHGINPLDTTVSSHYLYPLALVSNHLASDNFAAFSQLDCTIDRDFASIDNTFGYGAAVTQTLDLEQIIQGDMRLAMKAELLHQRDSLWAFF